jgi:hypothetical protein
LFLYQVIRREGKPYSFGAIAKTSIDLMRNLPAEKEHPNPDGIMGVSREKEGNIKQVV